MPNNRIYISAAAALLVLSGCSPSDTGNSDLVAETASSAEPGVAESAEILDGEVSPGSNATTYTFRRGFPQGQTADLVYENSQFRRAVEAYKTFLPTVATEAVIQQIRSAGAVTNKTGVVMAQGPRQQFAAANSDTPYSFAILDLSEGPIVVELPPNPLLLGLVNDHNMRWISDVGGIGPENGQGGKHLIMPPDWDGDKPEGYFVSQSKTWMVVIGIRSVPLDGDVSKAVDAARGFRVYPYRNPQAADDWSLIDVTKQPLPLPLLDWEGRIEFWRVLHGVIQGAFPQDEDRFAMGALEQLGIKVGEEFAPNSEQAAILENAAKVAHAELSISLYANRAPERIMWDDRRWEILPLATMYLPKGDFGTRSLISREAWDQYFFFGWGTGSTIGKQEPGAGSMYFTSFADSNGQYLDGNNSYKLTIPGPVPAELFWSVTVYDAYTRCLIEAPLDRAAVRSHMDDAQANADGSYTIYFSPDPPETFESNWVQTLPGRGWFTTVRLYGPGAEVFDGRWKLSDISKTN